MHKPYPIYDQNGRNQLKLIPYLWPIQSKNHTLWGRTYLYSRYKGVPPPPTPLPGRSVSVYRGFPSRCTFNCDRIERAAKKKDKERLIAGLTIGRRKLQLKCKFCFVFQRSFVDKFSVSCAFFLHDQRVSLRLPLSVLSDIIISRNEQFLFYLFYLFIPFSLH